MRLIENKRAITNGKINTEVLNIGNNVNRYYGSLIYNKQGIIGLGDLINSDFLMLRIYNEINR